MYSVSSPRGGNASSLFLMSVPVCAPRPYLQRPQFQGIYAKDDAKARDRRVRSGGTAIAGNGRKMRLGSTSGTWEIATCLCTYVLYRVTRGWTVSPEDFVLLKSLRVCFNGREDTCVGRSAGKSAWLLHVLPRVNRTGGPSLILVYLGTQYFCRVSLPVVV